MAADQPVAAVLFYRSHLQAANTGSSTCSASAAGGGLNPLPIAVASLKEPAAWRGRGLAG
jgi:cobaltochelatase CobN